MAKKPPITFSDIFALKFAHLKVDNWEEKKEGEKKEGKKKENLGGGSQNGGGKTNKKDFFLVFKSFNH